MRDSRVHQRDYTEDREYSEGQSTSDYTEDREYSEGQSTSERLH